MKCYTVLKETDNIENLWDDQIVLFIARYDVLEAKGSG